MNSQVGVSISFFGVIFLLLIFSAVVAVILRIGSWVVSSVFRYARGWNHRDPGAGIHARHGSDFGKALFYATGFVLLAAVFVANHQGVRQSRSVADRHSASRKPPVLVRANIQEAVQDIRQAGRETGTDLKQAFADIQQARNDIRSAVREAGIHVGVDLTEDELKSAPRGATTNAATISAATTDETTSDVASALPAESVPGAEVNHVVVFEANSESLARLLGENSDEILAALKSDIPTQIRRTYALIPLTVPAGPVSTAGRPLAAADGLRAFATTLARIVEQESKEDDSSNTVATEASVAIEASPPAIVTNSTDPLAASATTNLAANADSASPKASQSPAVSETVPDIVPEAVTVVAEADESARVVPAWLTQRDGLRVVVETEFRPASDDGSSSLKQAVNTALMSSLESQDRQLKQLASNWTRFVRLNLTEQAMKQCIVATYDQNEIIETREGPKPMKKTFALVEFPEAVDRAAADEVRQSVQRHRLSAVGVTAGMLWMAVASGGLLYRFGRNGTGYRKLFTYPAFVLVPVPLAVMTIGMIAGMANNVRFDFPWERHAQVVQVDVNRVQG